MKTNTYLPAIATVLTLGIALPAYAADETPAPPAPAAEGAPAPAKRKLSYTPPKDAPKGARMDGDGGSRGGSDSAGFPKIYLLAPKEAALTAQSAPALFWFQDKEGEVAVELTVTSPKVPKPLVSLKSGGKQAAGIKSVSLARQKVTLEPNVPYQWSVAISGDTKNRSKDVIASGIIQRKDPTPEFAAKIEAAPLADRAVMYAEAGYWYDAVQAISTAVAAAEKGGNAKEVAELKELRAALFDQGSLKEAAAADRK